MIVWLDLETTGLNPLEEDLLEAGIIVTNDNLEEVVRSKHLVETGYALNDLSDVVRRMHNASGLLDDYRKGPRLSPYDVAQRFIAVIDLFGARGAPLGGSTIAFDRMMLWRHMPDLLEAVHYRSIDVSTLNELGQRWAPEACHRRPQKRDLHRVFEDIEDSINVAKYWGGFLYGEDIVRALA